MRRMTRYGLPAFVLAAIGGLAQTAPNPLAGVWHNVAGPPVPQVMLILTTDGYYARIAIPPGRSEPKNDFDHRTREELMKQFGGVRASYGTYKVTGTRLTRTVTASEDPGSEGKERIQEFRFEGDVLVLKSPDDQREARFRRMK